MGWLFIYALISYTPFVKFQTQAKMKHERMQKVIL